MSEFTTSSGGSLILPPAVKNLYLQGYPCKLANGRRKDCEQRLLKTLSSTLPSEESGTQNVPVCTSCNNVG